jgi:hypothetical protein
MGTYVALDNAAVTELLQGPSGPVYADIARRTLNVHAAAVRNCPVSSVPGKPGGRLRSSLRWSMGQDEQGLVGVVGTDVIYAQWASDHAIDPSKRDYLINALKEAGN